MEVVSTDFELDKANALVTPSVTRLWAGRNICRHKCALWATHPPLFHLFRKSSSQHDSLKSYWQVRTYTPFPHLTFSPEPPVVSVPSDWGHFHQESSTAQYLPILIWHFSTSPHIRTTFPLVSLGCYSPYFLPGYLSPPSPGLSFWPHNPGMTQDSGQALFAFLSCPGSCLWLLGLVLWS